MAIATEVFADENRVVEREMTEEEISEIEAEQKAKTEQRLAEEEEKAAAKAAVLSKLGISEEELKAALA